MMGQWAEDCLEAEMQGITYDEHMENLCDEAQEQEEQKEKTND